MSAVARCTAASVIVILAHIAPTRAWGYAAERNRSADFLVARFDTELSMLKGVWAGGDGYEANAYSLIDVNFFASRGLSPYNASVAKLVAAGTSKMLVEAHYECDDRRENMYGRLTTPIWTVDSVTVKGSFPAPPAPLWVVTEKVNKTRSAFAVGRPYGVNAGVVLALSYALGGDLANATAIMGNIASWWNSSTRCIMEPVAIQKKVCFARALSYFLFGVRALRLDALLPANEVAAMEAQLWSLQVINCSVPCGSGKAMAVQYRYGGAPDLKRGAHDSTEPSNLALLAYDERIQTEWFPTAVVGEPGSEARAQLQSARARRSGARPEIWAARWEELKWFLE
jgi:hypothetical protein